MTMPATARFHLYRHHDVSGISGTGFVASGIQFADGTIALRWLGDRPATAVWDSLADVVATHGHNGSTSVIWLDRPPATIPDSCPPRAPASSPRSETESGKSAVPSAPTVSGPSRGLQPRSRAADTAAADHTPYHLQHDGPDHVCSEHCFWPTGFGGGVTTVLPHPDDTEPDTWVDDGCRCPSRDQHRPNCPTQPHPIQWAEDDDGNPILNPAGHPICSHCGQPASDPRHDQPEPE